MYPSRRRSPGGSHDHESAVQNRQCRGKSDAAGTVPGKGPRDLSKEALLTGRRDLHDGRSGSLKIGGGVEVAHQRVSADERPRLGNVGHPVWIEVAVARDRRRHVGDGLEFRKVGSRTSESRSRITSEPSFGGGGTGDGPGSRDRGKQTDDGQAERPDHKKGPKDERSGSRLGGAARGSVHRPAPGVSHRDRPIVPAPTPVDAWGYGPQCLAVTKFWRFMQARGRTHSPATRGPRMVTAGAISAFQARRSRNAGRRPELRHALRVLSHTTILASRPKDNV